MRIFFKKSFRFGLFNNLILGFANFIFFLDNFLSRYLFFPFFASNYLIFLEFLFFLNLFNFTLLSFGALEWFFGVYRLCRCVSLIFLFGIFWLFRSFFRCFGEFFRFFFAVRYYRFFLFRFFMFGFFLI